MAKAQSAVSQKDYLQKYLTGKNADKKKKKRKALKTTKDKRSVIVDDDEIKGMRELADGELDLFSMSEDAPQIAGIIDERPEELKTIETFRSSARWKVISDVHGIEDIQVVAVPGQPKSPGYSDDDLSPARETRDDSDESPPRKQNKDDSEDWPVRSKGKSPEEMKEKRRACPPIRQHGIDGEHSSRLSREGEKCRGSDTNKHRLLRGNHDDTDVARRHKDRGSKTKAWIKIEPSSPARRGSVQSQTKNSRETFVDSDESPPRRESRKTGESWKDKSGKKSRRDSLNESPPSRNRKKARESSEETARKIGQSVFKGDKEYIPSKSSRKRRGGDSDELSSSKRGTSDISPPRKHNKQKSRESQRSRQGGSDSLSRKSRRDNSDSDQSLPRRAKKTSENDEEIPRGPADVSSRRLEETQTKDPEIEAHHQTIYRDRKTGRRRDLAAEAQQRKEDASKTDIAKEKYTRWGAGLAQVAERETRAQEAVHEASKPVARFADDADLDAMLRARDREGDPMLEYLKQKSQDVSIPSKPRYAGSFPPNRYNIAPGHRWDGVDRSTGFERRWFEGAAARQAIAEDAYKWSVADM